MNQADQERRLQQLRGNAYGPDYTPVKPSDPVSQPSNAISGLRQPRKHVNLFEDLESGRTKGKVEVNPAREAELAAEKKKWEDMFTSKLVNATKDHSPWYSQLDNISGVDKEMSEVERELKEQKEMKWKSDADPLKQMERYLEKKREVDEREQRRTKKMEREMTEREKRRGRGPTPENSYEERNRHRSMENEKRKRRRHHRSRSRSPTREHRRHRHRSRSRSPPANIDQLRAEREKREAAERDKIDRLMKKEGVGDRYVPVGHGGYSAQFHPEAVRR
jgi:hypothetical protein